jgi:hypothetical protein
MAPVEEPVRAPARKRSRASQGPAVLAAMIGGVALGDIAKTYQITPKRVEKLLREELHKRWIAPAHEYARLQIARLETIATQLKDKCKNGDLPAIDRLLKVLDRLDRYHGFTKLAALAPAREDVRGGLIKKIEQAAGKAEREA